MQLPATERALDEILSNSVRYFGWPLVLFALVLLIRRSNVRIVASRFGAKLMLAEQRKTFKASDHANDGKYHLLLAATGSVATIKIPNILEALAKYQNLSIRLVLSESAATFLQDQSGEQPSLEYIANIKNVDGLYRDADEWQKPWIRGDSILHIELRRWADSMAIVPLSANSLAKIALGFSDNLVTSVVRAWDTTGMIDGPRPGVPPPHNGKKVILVAPAMNTAMWNHPVTNKHLDVLCSEWSVQNNGWFGIMRPIEKELACGDTGSGAMCDWREIVRAIEAIFIGVSHEAVLSRRGSWGG